MDLSVTPKTKTTKIMKRKIALFTALLALSGLAFYTNTSAFAQSTNAPQVRESRERHPAIRAAIRELERAKLELKNANHDFGGHRVRSFEGMRRRDRGTETRTAIRQEIKQQLSPHAVWLFRRHFLFQHAHRLCGQIQNRAGKQTKPEHPDDAEANGELRWL